MELADIENEGTFETLLHVSQHLLKTVAKQRGYPEYLGYNGDIELSHSTLRELILEIDIELQPAPALTYTELWNLYPNTTHSNLLKQVNVLERARKDRGIWKLINFYKTLTDTKTAYIYGYVVYSYACDLSKKDKPSQEQFIKEWTLKSDKC